MKVLLITDAVRLASVVYRNLTQTGFSVEVVGERGHALLRLKEDDYEMVILDNELGTGGGKSLIPEIRRQQKGVKVILIVAPTVEENKITADNSGADECLVKPFSPGELRRRILKYTNKRGPAAVINIADLVLHSLKRRVVKGNKELILSEKEFDVLEYLMLRKDQIVSREEILEFAWDYYFESVSNLIDMNVTHLRAKIESKSAEKLIQTYPKKGYVISEKKSLFD